jgi:Ca2+-transporting ATPase
VVRRPRPPGAAGWPLDAIVIACVVVLNAVLGWLQEAKAAQAVAALAKMTTATSAVLRDGAVARVPSAELVKGDVLVLAEGDAVGADARLAQAAALKLLEAPLDGRERGGAEGCGSRCPALWRWATG